MSSPMPWRRFATVTLPLDVILGEDPIDMAAVGFSGEVVIVTCSCGMEVGRVPLELTNDEIFDITVASIQPALEYHRRIHGCPEQPSFH